MLQIFFEFKKVLKYVFNNTINDEFQNIFILPNEWIIIAELIRVFQVFYKPTVRLQGEAYITLSSTLLDIYLIFNKLRALKNNYTVNHGNFVSFLLLLLFLLLFNYLLTFYLNRNIHRFLLLLFQVV